MALGKRHLSQCCVTVVLKYALTLFGLFLYSSSNFVFVAARTTLPKLRPIVIVPGIGGSQIQAKLDRNRTSHYWCYKSSDWFTMWLSIEQLLPMAKDCFIDNMRLIYNPSTKRMENTPGVYTRSPDFGNTSAIEWLDPSVHGPGIYFYPLVESFVNLGYKRGDTLRAAPYDFRFNPGDAPEYFERLRVLIEDTFAQNGNEQVMLVSHSMGAPYSVYFLKHQSQAWKDKYLHGWITISGAYAGSLNAVLAYISGDGFGIPSIVDKPKTLREFERTFTSMPFLLPDSRFWKPDEILVKTENRSYTVHDYDDLFEDIQFPLASKIRQAAPVAWQEDHPGVDTYCFYGSDVDTAMVLKYKPGYFPDYYPDIQYGSGDGTVPLRSLMACERWRNNGKHVFESQVFTGAEHNNILADARLVRAIMKVLGIPPSW